VTELEMLPLTIVQIARTFRGPGTVLLGAPMAAGLDPELALDGATPVPGDEAVSLVEDVAG